MIDYSNKEIAKEHKKVSLGLSLLEQKVIGHLFILLLVTSGIFILINSLPLSEYGKDLGLIIDYYTTDWYSNENNYIQKS